MKIIQFLLIKCWFLQHFGNLFFHFSLMSKIFVVLKQFSFAKQFDFAKIAKIQIFLWVKHSSALLINCFVVNWIRSWSNGYGARRRLSTVFFMSDWNMCIETNKKIQTKIDILIQLAFFFYWNDLRVFLTLCL